MWELNAQIKEEKQKRNIPPNGGNPSQGLLNGDPRTSKPPSVAKGASMQIAGRNINIYIYIYIGTKEENINNFMYNFDQDFTMDQLVWEPESRYAWIHISCAFWVPAVTFGDEEIMSSITGNSIIKSPFIII